MLTVVITKDEDKIKAMLTDTLKKQGYNVMSEDASGRIIRVIKNDIGFSQDNLKSQITGLWDTVYSQSKGDMHRSILSAVEKPLIEYALQQTEGNQQKAARILGINRNTMRSKIRKLNINTNQWKSS